MDDIHYSEHKVKYAIEKIKHEPGLSEEDRNAILEYVLKLQSQGLNAARVAKYAYSLIVLKRHLKCNFKDAGRAEIEELMRWLNSSEYTAWYKSDLKGILKRFYRWLRTGALDTSMPYPPEVAWVKANLKKNEIKEPMSSQRMRQRQL